MGKISTFKRLTNLHAHRGNASDSSKSFAEKSLSNLLKQSKLLLTVIVVLVSFTLGKAQCSVVGLNETGATVTYDIPCDFPILISTGNPIQDNESYVSEKNTWISQYQSIYDAIQAIDVQYYEIHNADFNQMSDSKKTAILANPEIYHVIN